MKLKNKDGKTFSLGGKITLQIIVLAGIIVLANFAALHAQFEWDISEGRIHTLDDATLAVLGQVDQPIDILVFASQQSEAADKLLRRFTEASSHIKYEHIRPIDDPARAEKYGVKQDGVVFVESGDRLRKLPQLREQTLLNAIVQICRGGDKTVLISTGHGEKDPLDTNATGFDQARRIMLRAGYQIVNEAITDESLKDAKVLIIASPQLEFDAATAQRVADYVRGGGGLLVLVDPAPKASMANLLEHFGVTPADDYIVELHRGFRHRAFGQTTNYVRAFHKSSPVGRQMNQPVLLTYVRSMDVTKPADDDQPKPPVPLCVTSTNSWGETGRSKTVSWNEGEDLRGPRIMAVTTTDETPHVAGKGRLMVIGTSNFAANRNIDTAGNREFFEAMVRWLADDLDAPSLANKVVERKLEMTDAQLRSLMAVCVFGIPAVTAVMGVIAFVRRAR